ncbi:ATP-grasp domain-containing protein [Schaalia canis]|uniref:Glutathione synthetase n=1 Tax=Schaalia canis TaxID=100469 RepID=A0A3P1SC45_9ACTO|nr:glutathione synthetase [Schaalia canis]RRC94718.1 glutathione synthetase [Schaalia canis]
MTKPRITLVTSADMPNLYSDEAGLLDALAERGTDPRIAVWNDPDEDWTGAGLTVVRSVSDYAQNRQAFLEWTKRVPRILNHPDVLEWNSDKHYMIELERMGLPVIPTTWLEPEQKLQKQQLHSRFPALADFVVKPAVSSGVRDIGRYTANDPYQRQAAITQAATLLEQGRSVMVQRYMEEIDIHGEISLVFFNGLMSHSVEKRAMLHPSSVTEPSMHEAVVTCQQASEEQWRWGEQIRAIMHAYVRQRMGRDEQFLFNRVDVVPDGKGSFRVMEASLVDADLYLTSHPAALGNFADAIAMRAFW